MPRSASSSSTSRYDSPYRRYQRTANKTTSGGNRKPANDGEAGRRRRSTRARYERPRPVNATVPCLGVLAEQWPDGSVRGTQFESFLRDAILVSPSHQFTEVWLWDDWPGRDGPDIGIDQAS
jgi:hypothetical protein